ncbi:MAG: hypothetical protein WDZ41_00175, partial [Candidatus Babeliales bacterium]
MKKLLFLLILSWQSIGLAMETDFSLKEKSIKGISPLSLKDLAALKFTQEDIEELKGKIGPEGKENSEYKIYQGVLPYIESNVE